MKSAIIESYLKEMENPPRTTEGVASLIGRLTEEMGFSPLSDDEIRKFLPAEDVKSALSGKQAKKLNKPPQANKKTKTDNVSTLKI